MDAWNETFFDGDAQASGYESSDSSQHSVSDLHQPVFDSEPTESESFDVLGHTQSSPQQEVQMVDKVREVLRVMAQLGINLVLFLDAVSWGDPACIADPKVRSARTVLMKSEELPSILRRWWKPPRTRGSSNARPAGATDVMMSFAHECYLTVVDKELEEMEPLFKSPLGDDVAEDHLTGIIFADLIKEVKMCGPSLWSLLHTLACRENQLARNTHKKPDKVCHS